jgi:hypothetical protein
MTSSLVHNPRGNYRFLGAEGRPFSGGAVAESGFDLAHATFERPMPLEAGIEAAARHVAASGRPVHAIAGFELRIPRALSQAAFAEFNRPYVATLRRMGLEVDGLMAAGRSNVSPTVGRVEQPSVFGFTFTVPRGRARPGFVLSGVPEEVHGDARAMFKNITDLLGARARDLGCRLGDATAIQLYADVGVDTAVVAEALREFGEAAVQGLRWFPSLPPIEGLTYEIDARSTGTESTISA